MISSSGNCFAGNRDASASARAELVSTSQSTRPRIAAAQRNCWQLLLVACGFLATLTTSSGQIKYIAETRDTFTSGLTYGLLGLPSIAPNGSGGWNLAAYGTLFSGSTSLGGRELFFTNSGVPTTAYNGSGLGSLDGLPTSGFASLGAVYLDDPFSNSGVYSGSTALPSLNATSNFIFGRPSAFGGVIAHSENNWTGSTFDPTIVAHVGTGSPTIEVSAASNGFDVVGMTGGTNPLLGISFGRGGGTNIAFRGHHSSNPAKNGIFVKRYGSPGVSTVVDNTFTNPITSSQFNFTSGDPSETVLPVAHGLGAAWTHQWQGVLAKPGTGNPIVVDSGGGATYGNVSSGGGGMLAYERTPSGQATQIWTNLMGKKMLCVDRTMITRRTALDLSMGSEAVVSYGKPFSLGTGGYTLAFHAYQLAPENEAIYVRSIRGAGIDLGGVFNANRLSIGAPLEPHFFSIGGGGGTGAPPPDSDYLTMVAHNSNGGSLPLAQNYGFSLGVDSGFGDDPYLLNSITQAGQTISEGVSLHLDYDVIFDDFLFTQLDVGEIVRYGIDGSFSEIIYDGSGQDQYIDGIQGIELQPLYLRAGSTLTIEHGGVGDGFGLSSFIMRAPILGDFDFNGSLDTVDIDQLVANIASGSSNLSFDVNGDALIDVGDLGTWLQIAGQQNLASGNPYLRGDANLDGVVDGQDFIAWNSNKFTFVAAWSKGDFNADGVVDGQDFIEWNANKFTSSDGVSAVPEPSALIWLACGAGLLGFRRRRFWLTY